MGRYPDYNKIRSRGELKEAYERAVKEINEYKQASQRDRNAAKKQRESAERAKRENRALKQKNVIEVTRAQKAKAEQRHTAIISGASTTIITILYQIWNQPRVGFPYRHELGKDFWEHEAVYGALVYLTTILMGWAYRSTQRD